MKLRLASCVALVGALSVLAGAARAADGLDRVLVTAVPQNGQPAAARADGAGVIHLLYETSEGPRYSRSSDKGRTLSPGTAIVNRSAQKPGLTYQVFDMAVNKAGRVHVALMTNAWKLKLPKDEWGFHYAQKAPGEGTFAPVRNINRKPSEGFSLAADEKGTVVASWLADKLYANVSTDDGRTFGPTVEIDPAVDPCNCCTTSSVWGGDGRLALLYREETNNERDMFLLLWNVTKKTSQRVRVSKTPWKIDSCPMTYYSIAATDEGYLAAWPTKEQVHFARLDRDGNLLPPGEIKTPGRNGHRTGILVLAGKAGETLVAWKKDNRLGWQRYAASGLPEGETDSVGSMGNGIAGAVTAEGRFILFR